MSSPTVGALSLMCLVVTSCGGDTGDGPDPCLVEGTASFEANVAPLLHTTCAIEACHGARPKAGLSLDGPSSDVYAEIVGRSSETAPDLALIEPGDPDASFLIHKVRGELGGLACVEDDCGVQMPKADDPLRAECVDMLTAWVEAGASQD